MHLPNIDGALVPEPKISGYIDGRISGPTGTAVLIKRVWFIEDGERSPRFITSYPLRGVQK